ncbi:hypothetical protein JXA32_05610 [Candidatus Sumerlaeota bacterium]|nr:hypothetical protein [Candidatus Sumerlaeota bacterium]
MTEKNTSSNNQVFKIVALVCGLAALMMCVAPLVLIGIFTFFGHQIQNTTQDIITKLGAPQNGQTSMKTVFSANTLGDGLGAEELQHQSIVEFCQLMQLAPLPADTTSVNMVELTNSSVAGTKSMAFTASKDGIADWIAASPSICNLEPMQDIPNMRIYGPVQPKTNYTFNVTVDDKRQTVTVLFVPLKQFVPDSADF